MRTLWRVFVDGVYCANVTARSEEDALRLALRYYGGRRVAVQPQPATNSATGPSLLK